MRLTTAALSVLLMTGLGCVDHSPCAGLDMSGDAFLEVRGDHYLGAIVPSDHAENSILIHAGEEFWTPTPIDIQQLEATLESGLRRAGASRRIIDDLSRYRRQYVGIVTDEGRRILVNAFPGEQDPEHDWFCAWRYYYVFVHDGGDSFWRIQYDVASGQFDAFEQNAEPGRVRSNSLLNLPVWPVTALAGRVGLCFW